MDGFRARHTATGARSSRRRAVTAAALIGLLAASAAPASAAPASAALPVGRSRPTATGPVIVRAAPLDQAAVERLDIVVVLLDDVGKVGERLWARLPVIRRTFLENGVVFDQAFGDTPMCCPGRASFLTGLWTWHHGVIRNDARLFHDSETIATAMSRAGYRTIFTGKYLNAMPALRDLTPDGWWRTTLFEGLYYRYPVWRNGRRQWAGSSTADYSTDMVARDAVRYLREVPPDRRVFAVIAPYASHGGYDRDGSEGRFGVPAVRHRGDPRCAGLAPFRTPATDEADVSDKPAFIRELGRLRHGLARGWPLVSICETLLSADQALGAVRAELKRQGRLAQTVFVLVSDNGMNMGLHRLKAKGSPYATPIPLLVSWPGAMRPLPDADGIRRHHGLVSMVDLAPTLCEIAGCHLGPYPTGQHDADGRSVLDAFRSAAPTGRTTVLSSHPADDWFEPGRPGWFAIRTAPDHRLGAWLYVRYRTGEQELYDIADDAHLLVNLARRDASRSVRAELEAALLRQLGGRYRWP